MGKYTMIIADDEPVALKSEELFIRKEFPEIEIAGLARNGVELKEMLKKTEPDMAMVDIRMPGLSGIEVIELLQHRGCGTHFIICTAYSDFEYVKRALDLKTDGYILKPSKREEKLEVIGRLCRTVDEERQETLRQSGIRSALGVVNSVLGSEILMSVFSGNYDEEGFEAWCGINNVDFSNACIATFLPRTEAELSKRRLNEELERTLEGICRFLSTVTSRGVVAMLFVPEEIEPKRQAAWCAELSDMVADCLREKTGTEWLYGTGGVYSSFREMPVSYRESTEKLKLTDETAREGKAPGFAEEAADKSALYIDKTKQYIEVWLRKDISLADCAANVGISPWYLSHIFRERTGQTFVEYLSGVRIREAKRLCRETDLSLNEIAKKCGYLNITYFYKVFKRMTGMTVGEYRKKEKEE